MVNPGRIALGILAAGAAGAIALMLTRKRRAKTIKRVITNVEKDSDGNYTIYFQNREKLYSKNLKAQPIDYGSKYKIVYWEYTTPVRIYEMEKIE